MLATPALLQSGAAEAIGATIVAAAMPPAITPVHTAAAFLLGAIPLNFMINLSFAGFPRPETQSTHEVLQQNFVLPTRFGRRRGRYSVCGDFLLSFATRLRGSVIGY
ncbi:hypothetical protein [Mycobacterium sp. shizuoka-1]|uniref:hypothetical protein n=1 Tax=Mycobacterium sp. shizuoka-1 TaxID=2039281 RepID=UPI000C05FF14|nr:hypothetical protein [Mycobacterium sp. shizuoka-1]GAY18825.1 hypothetical protein MSZK_55510 [Mycobacterium sp. shizuoka-1]